MAITGWTDESSGAVIHSRDLGSSDNGSENATQINNIVDNGTYYTFNGTNSHLSWNTTANEDAYNFKIRFRLHNKNKNAGQVMWKSGGNSQGIALGLNASNNLGIFARKDGSLSSITFDNTEFEENVWYIMYASNTKITLYNTETETWISKYGSALVGDGSSGDESMGAGNHIEASGSHTSVMNELSDPNNFFEGDIDFVAMYAIGDLHFPQEALSGFPGENSSFHIIARNLGSSDDENAGADVNVDTADNGTYYTFNGTSSRLRWNNNIDESLYDIKAKFRIHDKSKNAAQVIWKSGGNSYGAAIGIDSSNNLGFFGRTNGGDFTYNVFYSTEYDENVWYIMYASPSKITLYNTETQEVREKIGSVAVEDGTSNESMGASDHETTAASSVIDATLGNDPAAFFDGDIDFVGLYNHGELDFPTVSGSEPTGPVDIEGVGGGFGSTITLSDPARLLILNESDLTMEYSKTVSGTIDVTGLTEEDKIILVRETNSGETFGYGAITPVQLGPIVPFTETFDGEAGTQPEADLWSLDANASAYGSLYGDGRWRWYRLAGSGNETTASLYFNYSVAGDFDVYFDVYSSGTKASYGYSSSFTRMEMRRFPGDWRRVGVGMSNTTIAGYSNELAFENFGGSWNQDSEFRSYSERNPTTYNIYRVNGDTIRVRWYDSLHGWQFNGQPYWECPIKETGALQPVLVFRKGDNNGSWTVNVYEMRINAGTITSLN